MGGATGSAVVIDTNNASNSTSAECQCELSVSQPGYYDVQYFSPDYKKCGLRFQFQDYVFSCDSTHIKLYFEASERITFTKDFDVELPSACFLLSSSGKYKSF